MALRPRRKGLLRNKRQMMQMDLMILIKMVRIQERMIMTKPISRQKRRTMVKNLSFLTIRKQ